MKNLRSDLHSYRRQTYANPVLPAARTNVTRYPTATPPHPFIKILIDEDECNPSVDFFLVPKPA